MKSIIANITVIAVSLGLVGGTARTQRAFDFDLVISVGAVTNQQLLVTPRQQQLGGKVTLDATASGSDVFVSGLRLNIELSNLVLGRGVNLTMYRENSSGVADSQRIGFGWYPYVSSNILFHLESGFFVPAGTRMNLLLYCHAEDFLQPNGGAFRWSTTLFTNGMTVKAPNGTPLRLGIIPSSTPVVSVVEELVGVIESADPFGGALRFTSYDDLIVAGHQYLVQQSPTYTGPWTSIATNTPLYNGYVQMEVSQPKKGPPLGPNFRMLQGEAWGQWIH